MALIVRSVVFKLVWLAWPVWVSFAVMATGNHFWLDIAAGWLCRAAGAAIVFGWRELRRRRVLAAAAP